MADTLLVGIEFGHDEDISVMLVGTKRPNESVEIVNAFQGEEAEDLYNKLIGKKGALSDGRC